VTPEGAVRAVADLLSDIGIPATLADLGVTRDQLDEIAENGLRARRLVQNNPVPLGAVEARELVELAFTGKLP
jgi:alcohol dehydrogenase